MRKLRVFIALCGIGILLFVAKTAWDVEQPTLMFSSSANERFQVVDRNGKPLGISYQNRFNTSDVLALHQIPELLRHAFVASEDRRFFEHHGVDWQARTSALWQNIRARKAVRGASTITEQVVRILHPRPRTLWSRWIEGFEAMWLERSAGKGQILEFYLNQVPYASNRRGVAQAARFYFNRDLDTLNSKEMLALAILPRAPSALDLYKNTTAINPAIDRLANVMQTRGEINAKEIQQIKSSTLTLEPASPPLNASHFIQNIRETVAYSTSKNGVLHTTLDSRIQRIAQNLLDERLKALKPKRVHNGAVLVVDHTTGEILAWVVGGAGNKQTPSHAIDAVRTPRQPGSSLKPFLYALALDSGWSPATILDDAPMAEAIGSGLHDFHNYSHTFYGKISLREALGNSLNIPALETIKFVGPEHYLDKLHTLGFDTLNQSAEFYKDGLALGNGEVTLFAMVQAYSTLANHGVLRPLTSVSAPFYAAKTKHIYSDEASSLIGNILSDPFARRREFGSGSVLNLPVQTAVKTGTSSDYRDAWVLGYNSRYTVGIWLGNLDQTPMDGVTGSTGPALVLRGIFAELNKLGSVKPLYLSPTLVQKEVCTNIKKYPGQTDCYPYTEYFIPGTESTTAVQTAARNGIKLVRPTEGLQIAYDPRIPPQVQAFEFVSDVKKAGSTQEWLLNGKLIATTENGRFLWPVIRGKYTLLVKEMTGSSITSTDKVHFLVK